MAGLAIRIENPTSWDNEGLLWQTWRTTVTRKCCLATCENKCRKKLETILRINENQRLAVRVRKSSVPALQFELNINVMGHCWEDYSESESMPACMWPKGFSSPSSCCCSTGAFARLPTGVTQSSRPSVVLFRNLTFGMMMKSGFSAS